jgi:four helix bundle protein
MDEAGRIRSYRDLQVWQLGMDLAEACYLLTRRFPKDELFGMTSQIRRAASSVPANIAEGYGRESKGEYVQFLRVAQGSLKELETHLTLSRRVGLMSESETKKVLEECDHLGRMLHRLIRSLQAA